MGNLPLPTNHHVECYFIVLLTIYLDLTTFSIHIFFTFHNCHNMGNLPLPTNHHVECPFIVLLTIYLDLTTLSMHIFVDLYKNTIE